MNYQFFDKYLEEHGDFGECISNHKDKTLVYKEKFQGKDFYIKNIFPMEKEEKELPLDFIKTELYIMKKSVNI